LIEVERHNIMPSEVDKDSKGGLTSKRLILFHANDEHEFEPFVQRFNALNDKARGWDRIMFGDVPVPTKAEVDAAKAKNKADRKDDDVDVLKRHEANIDCFNMLILCMDTSTTGGRLAYHLVRTCKKPDYPEGNCKMAYDKLVSKYAPKNTQSELALRRQYANTHLKSHEDPDEFMMKLEVLAMEINAMNLGTSEITDTDIMSHALCNLPENYDAIADGLERQFEDKKLTIDILREKLNARYTRLGKIADETDDSPEYALAAIASFKRHFKGVCWHCGKRGHKSSACDHKKDGQGMKCHKCGKRGHPVRECPDWKDEKENANVAVDDDSDYDPEELGF